MFSRQPRPRSALCLTTSHRQRVWHTWLGLHLPTQIDEHSGFTSTFRFHFPRARSTPERNNLSSKTPRAGQLIIYESRRGASFLTYLWVLKKPADFWSGGLKEGIERLEKRTSKNP